MLPLVNLQARKLGVRVQVNVEPGLPPALCDRVMVEHVEARVQGSDESLVRFKVDAIALDDRDVASLATAMQQRIEEACDTMLGTPGTTARVRFLPSKTTVQTVEVSGE